MTDHLTRSGRTVGPATGDPRRIHDRYVLGDGTVLRVFGSGHRRVVRDDDDRVVGLVVPSLSAGWVVYATDSLAPICHQHPRDGVKASHAYGDLRDALAELHRLDCEVRGEDPPEGWCGSCGREVDPDHDVETPDGDLLCVYCWDDVAAEARSPGGLDHTP